MSLPAMIVSRGRGVASSMLGRSASVSSKSQAVKLDVGSHVPHRSLMEQVLLAAWRAPSDTYVGAKSMRTVSFDASLLRVTPETVQGYRNNYGIPEHVALSEEMIRRHAEL